jgi:CRISPR-associated protein Csx10
MPEVIAIARQGLAIGGPAEVGFDKTTLPYVPGSTLRGALASAWIAEHGIPAAGSRHRDDFIRLFERDVRYGPLFQDGTTVVPLSAAWCKYPSTPACAGWSADAAVDGNAWTCPHCGHGTDTGKGEVAGVRMRRILRTELDDDGRPIEGRLYARHELDSGATYRGHLTGTHPWLQQPREICLGGRTSTRGLAQVQLAPEPGEPAARVIPASAAADGALVVRLTSPAVIVDGAGRPAFDPVPAILQVLEMPASAVENRRCWVRPVRVGGWHAASGLPKPTELALEMGSVVSLRFRDQPSPESLRRLATEGIGLRRIEGFGSVQVNPPPWRLAEVPSTTLAPAQQPVPALTLLRERGLLDDELTVRWLVSRSRLVLVERERDPRYSHAALFGERVPVFFDDAQADAVREIFSSPRLTTVIPLLEQELEQLASHGSGTITGGGGNP